MSVRTAHPRLAPGIDVEDFAAYRLRDAYQDYTTHVSPAQMAMSLASCSYIYWLCLTTDARRVADFGSGFTSYVLREYARNVYYDVEVISVDDSVEWLGWTAGFLSRHGFDETGLVGWSTVKADPPKDLDLIVYDFSSGPVRDDHFGFALDCLGPTGVAVFDDAQHVGHQERMRAECVARRYDLFDLGEWTKDESGRFAALAVKGSWSR